MYAVWGRVVTTLDRRWVTSIQESILSNNPPPLPQSAARVTVSTDGLEVRAVKVFPCPPEIWRTFNQDGIGVIWEADSGRPLVSESILELANAV